MGVLDMLLILINCFYYYNIFIHFVNNEIHLTGEIRISNKYTGIILRDFFPMFSMFTLSNMCLLDTLFCYCKIFKNLFIGSYQEPGLGGHGPYRGPTSHYHCHEPHDDPVPVLIRPPPPIHGQNPYEVLTSSQFHPHDSYHHEAKVQFQLQDPHSYGKHYGPVYDVRHPEHAGRPAGHLDDEHEQHEHGHYRSQEKKKKHRKQKNNKTNTSSIFDLINHKDAVKRLKKIHGPSNQKNVSTLEKVKKVKSKQKARLNLKSKNKLPIKENIRLTDAKPLNNTIVPNMINKTFMNPFPNHYSHHTQGILGHIVPATLNQENKTFPSNTNTHLMGMREQDDYTPEARLIAPPVNNTFKHHQHQNNYLPDDVLDHHEEEQDYSPQETTEHPVSEPVNHHGENEDYIPDERITAHPENGAMNGGGEDEDYSDEEREAEAAVNEKIGDYEDGCGTNRKDCIKKKSKNKVNNIYKKFNSDLKISETIVDHMEHQVKNNFSKLGNQGQQHLNNSAVEFVGREKNHTSLALMNVGNKELYGKNETSRKVKLNKNFQLMKEAKTEASKRMPCFPSAVVLRKCSVKHFTKQVPEAATRGVV